MKTRKSTVFAIFIAILAVFCLFIACDDAPNDDSTNDDNSTNPDSTPKYTVSFNADGGSPAPRNQTISRGGKVTEPAAMSKTGYVFNGWYTEEDCINLWNFATDTVTANIKLYAKWIEKIENFTVTFNTNGGRPAPQKQTISRGGKITEPGAMTRTSYVFDGWYTEAACINQWNFSRDTVTRNITLYAKWNYYTSGHYTVSFVANGGSPAPNPQNIAHGGKVSKPQDMSKDGYNFEGWYKEEEYINLWDFDHDTVTDEMTLYAKWLLPTVTVSGSTLLEKLQWVAANAVSNGSYLLEVNSVEYLNPQILSFSGKSNISIQLIGAGGVRNIELYGSGSLFTIGGTVTLILNENIVLKGKTGNTASLVEVSGGNLIMNDGSKITDNTSSSGGGVYVDSGTFTMHGGEISGNTSSSSSGGGVYVGRGTFTMHGGEISGNTSFAYSSYSGSGVYVVDGTFIMNGGEISGNTSSSSGGGVYVGRGTFTMNGGEISRNTSSSSGGGVYVGRGTFTMNGGEISGNTSSSGGGVYVVDGTFTMNGGEISGNTSSSGGGVYVVDGTFIMNGGEISCNTSFAYSSYSYGGGVCINSSRFEKIGGIITGYTSDPVNGNVVKDYNGNVVSDMGGHAVYIAHSDSRFIRYKNTTSGPGDNLSYIRNEPAPPTISGAWD